MAKVAPAVAGQSQSHWIASSKVEELEAGVGTALAAAGAGVTVVLAAEVGDSVAAALALATYPGEGVVKISNVTGVVAMVDEVDAINADDGAGVVGDGDGDNASSVGAVAMEMVETGGPCSSWGGDTTGTGEVPLAPWVLAALAGTVFILTAWLFWIGGGMLFSLMIFCGQRSNSFSIQIFKKNNAAWYKNT